MFNGRMPLQKRRNIKYIEKTTKENPIIMPWFDEGPLWDQIPWTWTLHL